MERCVLINMADKGGAFKMMSPSAQKKRYNCSKYRKVRSKSLFEEEDEKLGFD